MQCAWLRVSRELLSVSSSRLAGSLVTLFLYAVKPELLCCIKVCFSLQVSLDARVREVINRKMQDPTPHTFEDAQLQIYTLMHRDSYPRFLASNIYKALVHGGSRTPSESYS